MLFAYAAAQAGEETLDHRGITREDIEEMTDNVSGGSQAPPTSDTKVTTEQEKQLMQEWELHMHDFVP